METSTGGQRNSVPVNVPFVNEITDFDSAEKFKKYIIELFDKNGVLNDLRAYLRGHIVEVIKSAQTGNPLMCQKHFTKRLELPFQALNIMIVEYLLRSDFSYTPSVFVSELPLANMMFDYAKSLLQNADNEPKRLRFSQQDVWSILNYLGIKCDSEHALNMMETYKTEVDTPLLSVVLKSAVMYRKHVSSERDRSSSSRSTVSNKSGGHKQSKPVEKCHHAALCKLCKKRIAKLKSHCLRGALFKRKIFDQLTEVYESEMEIRKAQNERKFKQAVTAQVLKLHQKHKKAEELLNEREKELERKMQQKKKFLWGLATSLRDQHAQMSRTMTALRHETDKLDAKENSLKLQMAEAQELLHDRGEEMRHKLSEELVLLDSHVQSMKSERDRICRERDELKRLKKRSDSPVIDLQTGVRDEDIRKHYELLKNELVILQKYLEMAKLEPKCVMERGTITDRVDSKATIVLNNEQELESYVREVDILKPSQVINELRNQKNVNLSQTKFSMDISELFVSSAEQSSKCDVNAVKHLVDENERLNALSKQQGDRIASLSAQQARMHAAVRAARPQARSLHIARARNSSSSPSESVGCRVGAGEEIGTFSNAHPRILVPGDDLPFIGVLKDRHNDRRRQAAHAQLCRMQRSLTPAPAHSPPPRPESPLRPYQTDSNGINSCLSHSNCNITPDPAPAKDCQPKTEQACSSLHPPKPSPPLEPINRVKSPKTLLLDAKKNLKSQPAQQPMNREKSPASVLREAKRRLRKLEIEAEAVDQCYRDIRQRQAARRESPECRNRESGTWETPEVSRSRQPTRYESPDCRFREHVRLESPEVDSRRWKGSESPEKFPSRNRSPHTVNQSYREQRQAVANLNGTAAMQETLGAMGENQDQPIVIPIPVPGKRRCRSLQMIEGAPPMPATHYPTPTKTGGYKLSHLSLKDKHDNYLSQRQIESNAKPDYDKNATGQVSPVRGPSQKNSKMDNLTPSVDEDYIYKPLDEFRKFYTLTKSNEWTSRPISPTRPVSPINTQEDLEVTKETNSLIAKKDALKKAKHKKQAEFEILKTNLSKMYNLKDTPDTNSSSTKHENKSGETITLKTGTEPVNVNNTLLIEIENANGSNEIKSSKSELIVMVSSAINAEGIEQYDCEIEEHGAISLVTSSPKNSSINAKRVKSAEQKTSQSPKQAANATRTDELDVIFDNAPQSKDLLDSPSETAREENVEHMDDFSEYSKRSDSQISVAKSDPDVFWD